MNDPIPSERRGDGTDQQLVRLMLRWYYGYQKAVEAHKADCGDAAIKPHFLSVYGDTDNVLGPMRDAGTLSDETCREVYEQANAEAQRSPASGDTLPPLVRNSDSEKGQ